MAKAPRSPRSGSKKLKSLSMSSVAGGRLFQAARNVVLRDGIMNLTTPAIAAEAGRSVGTVGRISIDKYCEHVVAYPFACLIVAIAPEGYPGCRDRQAAAAAIDRLIQDEPEIAALALASLSLGAPINRKDMLRRYFAICREYSITTFHHHALSALGFRQDEAEDFATFAVERFFERSAAEVFRSSR